MLSKILVIPVPLRESYMRVLQKKPTKLPLSIVKQCYVVLVSPQGESVRARYRQVAQHGKVVQALRQKLHLEKEKKDFCYILFVSREFSSSRLLAPVQLHGGGGVGGQRGGRGGARVPGVAEHQGLRKI